MALLGTAGKDTDFNKRWVGFVLCDLMAAATEASDELGLTATAVAASVVFGLVSDKAGDTAAVATLLVVLLLLVMIGGEVAGVAVVVVAVVGGVLPGLLSTAAAVDDDDEPLPLLLPAVVIGGCDGNGYWSGLMTGVEVPLLADGLLYGGLFMGDDPLPSRCWCS